MSSIDGLFEQIIHYEKTAQEQKNFLQELRQSVFSTQEKDKALKQRYADLKNKLTQKIIELSDKELVYKWLSSQETIFREEHADLKSQLEELSAEKKEVLKKLVEEKEKFCAKISEFTAQFGPRNCGNDQRELGYASQLAAFQQEKNQLSSGLEDVKAREEFVSNLCKEKEKLQQQLDKVTAENNKLTSSLCEELQRSADLQQERQLVSDLPNMDLQFTSIQEQLGEERQVSVELEEKYSQLQSQLHQLHQKLWQQQLKQQQQPPGKQNRNTHNYFTQQKLASQQALGNPNTQNAIEKDEYQSRRPLFSGHPIARQQNEKTKNGISRGEDNRNVGSQSYKSQRHKSQGQKSQGQSRGQSVQNYIKEDQGDQSIGLGNKVKASNFSQQNCEQTDNCLEDCSDVMFSDSDELTPDNGVLLTTNNLLP